MSLTDQSPGCDKVPGFGFWEKFSIRTAFYAAIALGAWGAWTTPGPGIGPVSGPVLAVLYVAYALGSYTLLIRYSVCPRCPHLAEADDCVFVPAPAAKAIVDKRRTGKLRPLELAVAVAAGSGTALLPLLWLPGRAALLAAFAAANLV